MSLWHCPNCGLVGPGDKFCNICADCNTQMSLATIEAPVQYIQATYVRTSSGTPEEIALKRAKFEEDRKYRLTENDFINISTALGFVLGYLSQSVFDGIAGSKRKFGIYEELLDKIEYQRKKLNRV